MATCKNTDVILDEQERYLDYLKNQLSDKKEDIAEHRKNVSDIRHLITKSRHINTNGYKADINRLTEEIKLDMRIETKYKTAIKNTERKIKSLKARCRGY